MSVRTFKIPFPSTECPMTPVSHHHPRTRPQPGQKPEDSISEDEASSTPEDASSSASLSPSASKVAPTWSVEASGADAGAQFAALSN
ncbi:hypothetical protein scyTo_0016222 [Scyliorhinus torazame]|uniref:Uncharacterized protein n=1 Tax=Scyliorhinus torazame TaxID=75743 RepID=A0A401Q547_SCYTO|nr:hypothetical protein [Scyliorhinus torazame]